jgi:hypothetical protein
VNRRRRDRGDRLCRLDSIGHRQLRPLEPDFRKTPHTGVKRGRPPTEAGNSAMAEKSNVLVRQVPQWMTRDVKPEQPSVDDLEKRLGDLERRHDKTRKLLINALTLTATIFALLFFQPDWVGAFMIGIVCNLFVPAIIEQSFLKD